MALDSPELRALLTTLDPWLHPGEFAFVNVPEGTDSLALDPIMTFRETEGRTAIVEADAALRAGLPIVFRCACITLRVHSELEAVGLTAAVSTALAEAGIACNVVAAVHHDHLFVPVEMAQTALQVLRRLQAENGSIRRLSSGPEE